MKFIIICLTLMLIQLTAAQFRPDCPRCPQEACPRRCWGDRNIGVRCFQVPPRRMWYYDPIRRRCRDMPHLGCGGNANRWCSREACESYCAPPLG